MTKPGVAAILKNWTVACQKEVEARLSEEVDRLSEIDLSYKLIGFDRSVALGRVLRQRPFPSLERLLLQSNNITNVGIIEIVEAIKKGNLPSLQVLNLLGNTINDAGAILLCESLETGCIPRLHSLSITLLNEKDVSMVALAEALGSGRAPALNALTITSTIGTKGADALAAALGSGHLRFLEDLSLGFSLSQDAALVVILALETAPVQGFKKLLLKFSSVGVEGARALARALVSPKFSSLVELGVLGNNDMAEVLIQLCEALKNPNLNNLQVLNMDGEFVGDEVWLGLAALFEAGRLPSLQDVLVSESSVSEPAISERGAPAIVEAYRNNPTLIAKIRVLSNANWWAPVSSSRYLAKTLLWPNSTLVNNAEGFRRRNERLVRNLKLLKDEPDVPGTRAKVFLCGQSEVGKTTLRKSLCKSTIQGFADWTRKPTKEERTRGIEVSRIERDNLVLGVWDLAGQEEYHILHSKFLPDSAFVGQATMFVIVCSANCSRESSIGLAKQQLEYWLKFISSSSIKGVPAYKRHVFLVLNSFRGDHSLHDIGEWTSLLTLYEKKFEDFLIVHHPPFIINAWYRNKVMELKEKLLETARSLLKDRKMPKICREIQQSVHKWVNTHRDYPILSWSSYVNRFGGHFLPDKLMAATEYLHATGQIFFFREGALGTHNEESIVILEPQWFCQTVVGNVLLPDSLLRSGETSLRACLRPDGSIPISAFQAHFRPQLDGLDLRRQVIGILLGLGLAYKVDQDSLLIPALISNDDVPQYWRRSSTSDAWIMGFSLVVEDASTTLLPLAVFRELQVDLARDDDFGARPDSKYFAGRNLLTLKHRGMGLLVEYGGDPVNRLDVLSLPLVSAGVDTDLKERQVNSAQAVLDKILLIRDKCFPGVALRKMVVCPWSATEGLKSMQRRDVSTAVDKVKEWVKQNGLGKPTSWIVLGKPVLEDQLLSSRDLRELRISADQQCHWIERAVVELHLSSGIEHSSSIATSGAGYSAAEESTVDIELERSESSRRYDRLATKIDGLMLDQRRYIEEGFRELRRDFKDSLQRRFDDQKCLIDRVQSLERFSVSELQSSVPRFIFLAGTDPAGKPSTKWMKLRDALALKETSRLHFLCEAHYPDHALHVVDGQEGVELSRLKQWVAELAPVLEWSLKITFILAKIAGTALLPGLGLLMPDISQNAVTNMGELGKAGAELQSYASSSLEAVSRRHFQAVSLSEVGGDPDVVASAARDDLEARGRVRAALRDLLDTMSAAERMQKLALRRVIIADSAGSAKQVVWICDPCYSKYDKHENVMEI